MNIDFHSHYLPENCPHRVRAIAHRYHPQVSDGPRGGKLLAIGPHSFAPHTVELFDLDAKMLTMDMPDFYLSNLIGYPTETALAAATWCSAAA